MTLSDAIVEAAQIQQPTLRRFAAEKVIEGGVAMGVAFGTVMVLYGGAHLIRRFSRRPAEKVLVSAARPARTGAPDAEIDIPVHHRGAHLRDVAA